MKRGIKLLVICPYPTGKAPSQRLKYEQYFPFFSNAGMEIEVKPFIHEEFWKIIYKPGNFLKKIMYTVAGYCKRFQLLFQIHHYDIVYIHLWVTPFGYPIFEKLVRRISKKIVYDIDDMIFLGHSSDANKFIENLKGRQKMLYLMRQSDHVITCTPTLDQFVRNYNQKTTDISSTIDTDHYQIKNTYTITKPLTLGWSGSHSTSKYLLLLEDAFEKLLEAGMDFEVLVIGDPTFKFLNPAIPIRTKEWNLHTEVEDLNQIDIGLYPLPHEQWVLGKSGLKALQYMALGIPTIATKIGANTRIIENGINGYLIEPGDTISWLYYIKILKDDEILRSSIGTNARKTVVSQYSLKANVGKYLNVFNSLFPD